MKLKNLNAKKRAFYQLMSFLLVTFFPSQFSIFAQSPLDGPGIQWFNSHWLNMETTEKSNSGEDWYYDLKPTYNDAIVTGYVGAGFSSQVNSSTSMPANFSPFNCYLCGQDDFDETDLEHIDYEAEGGPLYIQKGCPYPKLAKIDLKGNVNWYKIYNKGAGAFRQVIQLTDQSGFIAVGYIKFDGLAELIYNPGFIGDDDELPICSGTNYHLLYLAKVDNNGVLISDAVYGMSSLASALSNRSEGYDIIQDVNDGNIVIAGLASNGGVQQGFLLKINKDDLSVIFKKTMDNTAPEKIAHATAVIENQIDNKYYVAYTINTNNTYSMGHIRIQRFLENGNFDGSALEITNAIDTDIPTSATAITTCVAYNMVFNNNDLLVAAEINRNDNIQATATEALVKVYRIDLDGTMSVSNKVNAIPPMEGVFRAYDLKVGITNTSDGGYAIVSTKLDHELWATDQTVEYFEDNSYLFDYNLLYCWNSDAYIAKFDENDNMLWRQRYPFGEFSFNMFPDDIRALECLYEIVETQDGGLTVAGNNSENFDDDFIFKIYSDCNILTTYNEGDINQAGILNLYGASNLWNSNKKVRGIIQINDGATLTINNNATIQFADSKADNWPTYILVKRGGRLIIEGGAKLTGIESCNSMWEGIYVEGTYGINHPSPSSLIAGSFNVSGGPHGLIKLGGGATIENSRVGINLGLPQQFGNFPNYGGGIIISEDVNYINNCNDIVFHPFNKTNIGFIRHCEFVTSSLLLDPIESLKSHITLTQVKNVKIRGNSFENSTGMHQYYGVNRGVGITGIMASFVTNDYPAGFGATAVGTTTGDSNFFTGLYYGVYATQGPLISDNVTIDGNVFTNNNRSIYLGSTLMAYVNRNTFIFDVFSNYGIYLNGSTGYSVQENTITGAGVNELASGIIVNQSGISSNLLYRNTMTSIKYGVKVQGNNGNASNGLELKCNTFNTNRYDIALISQDGIPATFKKNQGYCGTANSPANNLFSDPSFVSGATGKQIIVSPDDATNYYYLTFHRDINPLLTPFASPAYFSNKIDPALVDLVGFSDDFGCTEISYSASDRELSYCPTNFTTETAGGTGRLANPMPITNQQKGFNILNPYNLPKTNSHDTRVADGELFTENVAFNLLAGYYMREDLGDSLNLLIESNESLIAESIRASIAIDSSEFLEANAIVESIDAAPAAEILGMNPTLQYAAIQLEADSITWFQVDSLTLDVVASIATNSDNEGILANSLLEVISDVNYEEPIYDINDTIAEDELRVLFENTIPAAINSIAVYPNPVAENSIVEVNIEFLTGNDLFLITDINGRLKLSFPITENISYFKLSNQILPPGVYIGFVKCVECNKLTQKIVVVN